MHATPHALIASLAGDLSGQAVLDLGSGREGTLLDIRAGSGARLAVALDVDRDALASRTDDARCVVADLSRTLPFGTGAFDVVLSHNTLECLADPHAFLSECKRILARNGTLLLGHTEFDSITLNATDADRNRRVVRAYCDLPVLYRFMQQADSQMGRKLPGLLRDSGFSVLRLVPHVRIELGREGPAASRIDEMAWSVRRAASAGKIALTEADVGAWLDDLDELDGTGHFFFSETAYIALAKKAD